MAAPTTFDMKAFKEAISDEKNPLTRKELCAKLGCSMATLVKNLKRVEVRNQIYAGDGRPLIPVYVKNGVRGGGKASQEAFDAAFGKAFENLVNGSDDVTSEVEV
jgi:hypothetical protein